MILFQSSSSPKAGCNWWPTRPAGWAAPVSILIQPEGRMQQHNRPSEGSARRAGFNPHPARRPDATANGHMGMNVFSVFQSSSSPKAGCNGGRLATASKGISFNPHPARRPDATPGYVFSTQSSRTSPVASEIGQLACNCSACFPHVLSMNANLLLTGAIAIGSRHASSGSVKSITLPCPYSSTRWSLSPGIL